MGRVIMLRLGEITVKSKRVREKFVRTLLRNIEDALNSGGFRYRIRREWGRIFIYTDEKAVDYLVRVFGIVSLSIAEEVEFENLEDLAEKALHFFREKIRGKRFAVRARRKGRHDFTSMDVQRTVGARLLPYSAGVDLGNPEATAYIEIRDGRAYFYTDIVRAHGGLPIGSEGRVVALVSGGFDSAVAAWYMLKRGAEVHYVFCNLDGLPYEIGTISVLKMLAEKWSYGYSPVLYILDFEEVLRNIRTKCNMHLLNVILKRYMYRAAEAIAERIGAEAIVTGESLGQVASQTLRNLYVSSLAVRMQILRPLIGFDKDEIISMARRIGTYEASARVKEYCGAFAEYPRAHASLEEVLEEESKLPENILEKPLASLKEIDLKSFVVEEDFRELEVETIPAKALVVDLRSKEKFRRWHYPTAINIPFESLAEKLSCLGKDKPIVLLCDEGALSLEAAHVLQTLGYQAYSLKGGIRKLRRKG